MKKLILLLFLLMFIPSIVSADTGPHEAATLYFTVTYNNQTVTENFTAIILACRENGCEYDNAALCVDGLCKFGYYRIERVPRQMKLFVELNGENFTSNTVNFSWTEPTLFYDVNIMPGDKVIVTPSPEQKVSGIPIYLLFIPFLVALVLTIIIEIAVLIIFFLKWKIPIKKSKKPIWTIVIVDIISVPLVWVIFFLLFSILATTFQLSAPFIAIITAEIFAVVFEAYFIYWLNKKIISLGRSFILSLVMNTASFVIGGMILAGLLNFL